ncbi:hypothetical protein GCM10022287_21200 [Gryllotalpicola koreensis]|uniref:Peptidase S24/S26A/S26B/S26C domain-containing protein n=1 Tax=Gryllotalpicola koreensis TaxID=993086 RepID=A0ABP8A1A2_9MICO
MVEKHDPPAMGETDAVVAGGRNTAVAFVDYANKRIFGRILVEHERTLVRRAIINADEFDVVPIYLRNDATETSPKVFAGVVYRDDYGQ